MKISVEKVQIINFCFQYRRHNKYPIIMRHTEYLKESKKNKFLCKIFDDFKFPQFDTDKKVTKET